MILRYKNLIKWMLWKIHGHQHYGCQLLHLGRSPFQRWNKRNYEMFHLSYSIRECGNYRLCFIERISISNAILVGLHFELMVLVQIFHSLHSFYKFTFTFHGFWQHAKTSVKGAMIRNIWFYVILNLIYKFECLLYWMVIASWLFL
jgi:hypothetical protein